MNEYLAWFDGACQPVPSMVSPRASKPRAATFSSTTVKGWWMHEWYWERAIIYAVGNQWS